MNIQSTRRCPLISKGTQEKQYGVWTAVCGSFTVLIGLETVSDYDAQQFIVKRRRIRQPYTVVRIRPVYACRIRIVSPPFHLPAVFDCCILAMLIPE